jgi:hypothetical protein
MVWNFVSDPKDRILIEGVGKERKKKNIFP